MRAFLDGLLGSPVPILLVAKTLNSYSTQGLKSMTVADSCFPPSSSGTERHHRKSGSGKKLQAQSLVSKLLCKYSASRSIQSRETPTTSMVLLVNHRSEYRLVTGRHLLISKYPCESLQHKNQPTSGDSLPPEEEGCPGLDGEAEDWAVVVRPGRPGHRRGGLCHLGHPTVPRWPRGTWKDRQVSQTG